MTAGEGKTARATLTIVNRLGLHARAAALFVQAVAPFQSDVQVRLADLSVDGKSIMSLLMLEAGQGCSIEVEASGPDAEDAIQALRRLVDAGFHEAE